MLPYFGILVGLIFNFTAKNHLSRKVDKIQVEYFDISLHNSTIPY